MAKARTLPTALASQAAGRTDASTKALQGVMTAILTDSERVRGTVLGPLTVKEVMNLAGVNPKFIYGERHRLTTKPEVEAFVRKWNSDQAARKAAVTTARSATAQDEAAYWRAKYDKLAAHAHLWHLRMRNQQQRLQRLEKQLTHPVSISSTANP